MSTAQTSLHQRLVTIFGTGVKLDAVFTKTDVTFTGKDSNYNTKLTDSADKQKPGTYDVVVGETALDYTLRELPKEPARKANTPPVAGKSSPSTWGSGKVPF